MQLSKSYLSVALRLQSNHSVFSKNWIQHESNWNFSYLNEVGNNANIGIRGFTTWKQRLLFPLGVIFFTGFFCFHNIGIIVILVHFEKTLITRLLLIKNKTNNNLWNPQALYRLHISNRRKLQYQTWNITHGKLLTFAIDSFIGIR